MLQETVNIQKPRQSLWLCFIFDILLTVAILWLGRFGLRKSCILSQTNMTYLYIWALTTDNIAPFCKRKIPVLVIQNISQMSNFILF